MKIYTKTGDGGETAWQGGPRVAKHHPRIEAYGTVDELNASLGLARAELGSSPLESVLERIQHQLLTAGAELARSEAAESKGPRLEGSDVAMLEETIDRLQENLPPLRQFVLPGGTRAAATLHQARTICRRAERRIAALAATPGQQVSPVMLQYFNRLSDLLFVVARAVNAAAGEPETPWQKPPTDR